MKALFTLTSSESKRLIAKGVKALPQVEKALKNHTVIISGGTTNAFVAEEILDIQIPDKKNYTVGIITEGKTRITEPEGRIFPYVVNKGKVQDIHWREYLPSLTSGDVFIKGGNAIDHTGLAAVIVSDSAGGTIGSSLGILLARSIDLIVPIGLEKMIPNVREAVESMACSRCNASLGENVSLIPVPGAKVITELKALEILFNVKAQCIGAGGVGGSEGSVTLTVEGYEHEVQNAIEFVKGIKGEPNV